MQFKSIEEEKREAQDDTQNVTSSKRIVNESICSAPTYHVQQVCLQLCLINFVVAAFFLRTQTFSYLISKFIKLRKIQFKIEY